MKLTNFVVLYLSTSWLKQKLEPVEMVLFWWTLSC